MQQATERVRALARQRLGEGELETNQHGNVFWRWVDGRRIALGYNILEAEHFFARLDSRLDRALAADEEEE